MTIHSQIRTDQAFVAPHTPMFADLIEQLVKDDTVAELRRRDLISGLRRVAGALGLPPSDVPCSGRWLQPRLSKISSARLGITTKAWQNAVSDARSAMAHFGIVERRFSRIDDLTPEWRTLWSSLLEAKDKTLQPALCRFVYFLSSQGIGLGEVSDQHALAYREALIHNEISKSPDVAYRAALNGWNLAVKRLTAWPRQTLAVPSRQKIFTIEETAFPHQFRAEVADILRKLSDPDPFGEDVRTKPLRHVTIAQYRRYAFRFASELVHSGLPIAEISGLHVLLDPVMAERGLRYMLSRTGNKTTHLIGKIASFLNGLGKIVGTPQAAQQKLQKLAARLLVAPAKGMTRKNRDRLRVLQDARSQRRLLLLPDRIFAQPVGKTKGFTTALAREDALAIAILLFCPIRIKNLSEIHLDRNLHRPGDGRVYLVLVEDEIKNERPLEFELPRDLVRMIDKHLATRSPELCPAGTPWLFPLRDGQSPVSSNRLSNRLSKRIWKETGLEVNAHLFRHFAVMNWLDANPGAYEGARRLLGHSEVSNTIKMYSGLEVRAATKTFADLIEAKKGRSR
ncbi:hypothetical protein [Ciceribacter selenitireducens]